MKIIGYLRVSTRSQADEGVSLAAQEAKIRAWADLNGAAEVCIFQDNGASGGRADNRSGLKAALAAAGKGDALVIYSLSRLSRSLMDTVSISDELKRRGVDLVSVTDKIDTTTASGKLYFHIMAAFNQHYRDTISDQTKAALAYKRSRNEKLGSCPPFGQKFRGKKIVPVPEELAIIRQVCRWRAKGLSLRAIARMLESRNIRRKAGGKKWYPICVSRLLALHDGVRRKV